MQERDLNLETKFAPIIILSLERKCQFKIGNFCEIANAILTVDVPSEKVTQMYVGHKYHECNVPRQLIPNRLMTHSFVQNVIC